MNNQYTNLQPGQGFFLENQEPVLTQRPTPIPSYGQALMAGGFDTGVSPSTPSFGMPLSNIVGEGVPSAIPMLGPSPMPGIEAGGPTHMTMFAHHSMTGFQTGVLPPGPMFGLSPSPGAGAWASSPGLIYDPSSSRSGLQAGVAAAASYCSPAGQSGTLPTPSTPTWGLSPPSQNGTLLPNPSTPGAAYPTLQDWPANSLELQPMGELARDQGKRLPPFSTVIDPVRDIIDAAKEENMALLLTSPYHVLGGLTKTPPPESSSDGARGSNLVPKKEPRARSPANTQPPATRKLQLKQEEQKPSTPPTLSPPDLLTIPSLRPPRQRRRQHQQKQPPPPPAPTSHPQEPPTPTPSTSTPAPGPSSSHTMETRPKRCGYRSTVATRPCTATFTNSIDMMRHKRAVHQLRGREVCFICTEKIVSFARKEYFRKHLTNVHGVEDTTWVE